MERNPAMKNQLAQGGTPFNGARQYHQQHQGQGGHNQSFHNFSGSDQQIPYGSLPPRGGNYSSAYQNRQFQQPGAGMNGMHGQQQQNGMFPPALYADNNAQYGMHGQGPNHRRFGSPSPSLGSFSSSSSDMNGLMPPPPRSMQQRSPYSISPPPTFSNLPSSTNPLGIGLPATSWGSFHSNMSSTPPTPSSLSSLSLAGDVNTNNTLFDGSHVVSGNKSLLSTELDSLNLSTSVDSFATSGLDVSSLLGESNNATTSLLVPNPGKFTSNAFHTDSGSLLPNGSAMMSAVTSVGNISPFPSEASTDGEQVFNRDFGEFTLGGKPSSSLSFGSTPTTMDLSSSMTSAGPSWGSFNKNTSLLDHVFELNGSANTTSASVTVSQASAATVSKQEEEDEATNLKTELSVDEQLEALWYEN
jgi:hypothetical protein